MVGLEGAALALLQVKDKDGQPALRSDFGILLTQ